MALHWIILCIASIPTLIAIPSQAVHRWYMRRHIARMKAIEDAAYRAGCIAWAPYLAQLKLAMESAQDARLTPRKK